MSRQRDIEQYIKSFPESLKWLNECPICHHRGYRPDMPEHIGGKHSIMGWYLRRYFQPLETDELGLCMMCSRLQQNNGHQKQG